MVALIGIPLAGAVAECALATGQSAAGVKAVSYVASTTYSYMLAATPASWMNPVVAPFATCLGYMPAIAAGSCCVIIGASVKHGMRGTRGSYVARGVKGVSGKLRKKGMSGKLGKHGLHNTGGVHGLPNITWDCWKPILHEESTIPSQGRSLQDVLNDKRVKAYGVKPKCIMIKNAWREVFKVTFAMLGSGQIIGHAVKVPAIDFKGLNKSSPTAYGSKKGNGISAAALARLLHHAFRSDIDSK